MSSRSEAEISEAVRDCAMQCGQSADQDQCVSNYRQTLLERGWSEPDADVVARSTRQVLESIGRHLK